MARSTLDLEVARAHRSQAVVNGYRTVDIHNHLTLALCGYGLQTLETVTQLASVVLADAAA